MPFEITTHCKEAHAFYGEGVRQRLISVLPITIWVHVPAVPSNLCSCKEAYRVTEESEREIGRLGGHEPHGSYVCEHMGNLIE